MLSRENSNEATQMEIREAVAKGKPCLLRLLQPMGLEINDPLEFKTRYETYLNAKQSIENLPFYSLNPKVDAELKELLVAFEDNAISIDEENQLPPSFEQWWQNMINYLDKGANAIQSALKMYKETFDATLKQLDLLLAKRKEEIKIGLKVFDIKIAQILNKANQFGFEASNLQDQLRLLNAEIETNQALSLDVKELVGQAEVCQEQADKFDKAKEAAMTLIFKMSECCEQRANLSISLNTLQKEIYIAAKTANDELSKPRGMKQIIQSALTFGLFKSQTESELIIEELVNEVYCANT